MLLQIVPVSVRTPQGAAETYTLPNSGSQPSLDLEEFAGKIVLQGEPSVLQFGTINSTHEAISLPERMPLTFALLVN